MCGVVIAFWATRLLLRELATQDALTAGEIGYGSARLVLDVSLDWRVLVFTTGVAIFTALLFGIAPALRSLRAAPVDALKDTNALGTRSGAAPSSRFGAVRVGAAGGILITQVALSLMLTVSAGLFVRSFTLLSNVDLGLDASRAMIVNLRRNGDRRGEAPFAAEQLLESVRALPGVAAAAVSLGSPPISSGAHEMFAVSNADPPADPNGTANLVSPQWFAALGMRTKAGRLLTAEDTRGAPRVAVVNEAFVRDFLGGGKPDRPNDLVVRIADRDRRRRRRRGVRLAPRPAVRRPSTCRLRKPTAGSASCTRYLAAGARAHVDGAQRGGPAAVR